MIKEKIKTLLGNILTSLADKNNWSDFKIQEIVIERPTNIEFGDYTVNIAFGLAKQLGKSPQNIAQILADEINKSKPEEIERAESVGGYINFLLSAGFVRSQLAEIYKNRDSFGMSNVGAGRKVIVEYSSVNIAKPMHAGHLRNTLLGDALANILAFQGYEVIRWNYLGDWGTQFGKIIAAYKRWGDESMVESDPIKNLVELYVRFNKEAADNPDLERAGQGEFKKLEAGDEENRRLWEMFVKKSIEALKEIYANLDIRFDTYIGESFYESKLKTLVGGLLEKGFAKVGEGGAIIIDLEKYGLPPGLIRKSDGATLYMTRDIANLEYRLSEFNPEKIIYVVANEQALHFKQLFAIAEILGLNEAELKHVSYGLILDEDNKKLSTRKGKMITADSIIGESVDRAESIVREKNKELSNEKCREVANVVGLGALKYSMLKDHTHSDIVFSWERILDFRGNSGPYLQYTYARLMGILNKSNRPELSSSDLDNLVEKTELAIIKHLVDFPDIVVDSGKMYLTNNLALYLYELANLANRFYETTPIIKDEDASRRNARLVLISASASTLKSGLELLGINVLEKI
ncbi:MAG: arginine--tRNA ligase [Patescibacteria group bacterium]